MTHETVQTKATQLVLEPVDNSRLVNLCGQLDEHLRLIERRLAVQIANRGNLFKITGKPDDRDAAIAVLESLYEESNNLVLDPQRVHLFLQESGIEAQTKNIAQTLNNETVDPPGNEVSILAGRSLIKPRGKNQQDYLQRVLQHDINFGIGPAGTGKTFLAVACAVQALERDQVRRIILTRPAVEAGENLGFLPGDLSQKIDPYLRPLYDALYEMLGFEKVGKLIERNVIEVAPLAFMRGRSLNESFIILDEAQNTTREQMKMFLTRIGFGSTAIVTGDITQIDLPGGRPSGLNHAINVLSKVKGISFTNFNSKDVVRHALVQKIVDAYEKSDRLEEKQENSASAKKRT
ncbi:MAG: PhoH family protein [gamma proteobacterium symbiont of Bathyaustriella thionipta]|nr:PhoH family protein [gamma proteobacterium symbiont of Bathyaustriella thionipta]MCU7949157.1 PhoH family protein [gamma proteobacterium symbiont of Bathyaustriella thionipta]MCU7953363.1 PhoH family protein [gamma proteobacterium symbiont of Bathyaustriella thionipta]MCU7955747.1 PhoH family protein [gamma proteobacterium symbiont of Bathyaustriella thionipta]MCU7965916.1 PhoH family protein [gamma proteobacterium symbiont of Bathyaustriella thionipta]